HGQIAGVEFRIETVGVAADVGRVVPGAVIHQRPVEELRPRVVAVAVVVEQVGGGHLADANRDPVDVADAGELVRAGLDPLHVAVQAERLADEQAADVRGRGDGPAAAVASGFSPFPSAGGFAPSASFAGSDCAIARGGTMPSSAPKTAAMSRRYLRSPRPAGATAAMPPPS